MKYLSDSTIEEKIENGLWKMAEKVCATLGPKGHTVILQQKGAPPIVTKDGVTVAKFMELEDPIENMAIQILKESALRTSIEAGDGTTTTISLAHAFYVNCRKFCQTREISPILVKREIEKMHQALDFEIKKAAIQISSEDDIKNIACISSNNDLQVGSLVAEAFVNAGNDGSIRIDNSGSDKEDSLSITEGYELFSGYASSRFINDGLRHVAAYASPLIVVTDETVETIAQLMPALKLADRVKKPLVIVARSIEGEALASLIANAISGSENSVKAVALNAPSYFQNKSEVLQDLATSVGAKFFEAEYSEGIKKLLFEDFGSCKNFVCSKTSSIFVGGNGSHSNIQERISLLNSQIKNNPDLQECKSIQERVSRLSGCVVTIHLGGKTDVERNEKYYRVEDAVEAVRSGIEQGILPGGGVASSKIFARLPVPEDKSSNEWIAHSIFKKSLSAPFAKMLENFEEKKTADKLLESLITSDFCITYDIYNQRVCDARESGIVDPVKVVRSSLANAISVAMVLLTSSQAIIEM